jgi:hypothetical protein
MIRAPEEIDMATTKTIEQLNRELAAKLIDEAKRDSQSLYVNKHVGIANGQVVIVADDLDEVVRQLDQIESDPRKTFCLEIGPDYDKVYDIWEVW